MSSVNHTPEGRVGQFGTVMSQTNSTSPPTPTPRPRTTVCPYCGHVNAGTVSCDRCRGLFEPLSRQASQNSMGPWFIRDEANPFLPGCALTTLRSLIRRGRVSRDTIIRGPSTRQFWTFARNVPGIANMLGECHACHQPATAEDVQCGACGASFAVLEDRERLGLSDVRLLPGHAAPEQIAAATATTVQGSPPSENLRPVEVPQPSIVSEEAEELAHTLMAARQRKRRARRRTTIAVALVSVAVLAAAGVAAMLLLDRQSNSAVTLPEAPIPAKPEPSQTEQQAESESAPEPAPTEPASGEQAVPESEEAALRELLDDLASPDPAEVRGVLGKTLNRQWASDPRVLGGSKAAATRERILLLSKRL